MEVKNTNLRINEGAYILTFEANGTNRKTVICYDLKNTLKKYKKAGFNLFGSASLYTNNNFFALTKGFKFRTRNRKKIAISNEIWHINKAVERGNLTIEI